MKYNLYSEPPECLTLWNVLSESNDMLFFFIRLMSNQIFKCYGKPFRVRMPTSISSTVVLLVQWSETIGRLNGA